MQIFFIILKVIHLEYQVYIVNYGACIFEFFFLSRSEKKLF